MIMPFGKYKGEEILDIPVDYLEWVYDNLDVDSSLEEEISNAIDLLHSQKTRRGVIPKR